MSAAQPITAAPPAQPAGAPAARSPVPTDAPAFLHHLAAALGPQAGSDPGATPDLQAPSGDAANGQTAGGQTSGTQATGVQATGGGPGQTVAGAAGPETLLTSPKAGCAPQAVADLAGSPNADAGAAAGAGVVRSRLPGKPGSGTPRSTRPASGGPGPDGSVPSAVIPPAGPPPAAPPGAQSQGASAAPDAPVPAGVPGHGPSAPSAQRIGAAQVIPAPEASGPAQALRAGAPEPPPTAGPADPPAASIANAAPIPAAAPPGALTAGVTLSGDALARALAGAALPETSPAGRAAPAGGVSAASEPPGAASPAQQLAAPLVAFASTTDGTQRLTVRLDPEVLGGVQVRVDRAKDGPAQIEVTVERPETLALLLRDQPELHRALDQAGVPADGRSLTFQLATPDGTAHGGSTSLDPRQGGGGQPHTNEGSAEGRSAGNDRRDGAGEEGLASRALQTARPRWQRAGLDITA